MAKTIGGLVPFGIVLVGIAAAIWWLLSSENSLGKWLLAGFLVAHGLIHLLFLVPAPAASGSGPAWPFDLGQSWLVGNAGLEVGLVRVIGVALVLAVAGAFLLSGLATAGIAVPSGLWRPLVAASAVVSVLTLALFFDPQLVLGLAIDGVLLAVVATALWTPASVLT
jgi:hypothetical protein